MTPSNTMKNTMRQSKFNSIAIATVVALVVCLAIPAAAQAVPPTVHQWIGGDGNFTDVFGPPPDQGWDATPVFTHLDQYQINTGATVTVDVPNRMVVVLTVGADTGTGHLLITGAGGLRTNHMMVGNPSAGPPTSGTVIQTGGDYIVGAKAGTMLGLNGSSGSWTISGGTWDMNSGDRVLIVGGGGAGGPGTGLFKVIGGGASIIGGGILQMVDAPGASGTLAFEIDDSGITPMQFYHELNINDGTAGTRTLDISLGGPPPLGDLVLLKHRNCGGCREIVVGEFDGMPEGKLIEKSFAEFTYKWNLSYAYGADSNEVALVFDSRIPNLGPVTEFAWDLTGLGDWNNDSSWQATSGSEGTMPNSREHTAVFGNSIMASSTVTVDEAVTVNRIEFNNLVNDYAVAGQASVNLAAATDPAPLDPSISVTGNHQFQANVNLLNNTTVDVASSSTLQFNNTLDLMGNTLTKTGLGELSIRNNFNSGSGTVNCNLGVCSGSGTIAGDLNNPGGTVSPGNSPGVMVVEGNFDQGSDGTLLIELAGTAAGSEHDVLQVDGEAALAGTLQVSLIDGYGPQAGDSFDILDFGSITGDFHQILLPDLASGLAWDDSGLLVHGSLSVVPEPTTLVLLSLVGLIGCGRRRKRRE